MARTLDFEEWQVDLLRNREEAVEYLNQMLIRDYEDTDEDHKAMLAQALIMIGNANGVVLVRVATI